MLKMNSERKIKWIFCLGAQRSGSTLQYNMVSSIFETLGLGERVPHMKDADLAMLLDSKNDSCGIRIVKSHKLLPQMQSLVASGGAQAVYCYRDIRDAVVSSMNQNWLSDKIEVIEDFVLRYLKHHNEIQEFSENYQDQVMIRRYEAFFDNVSKEIQVLAGFMKVELDEDQVKGIVAEIEEISSLGRIGSRITQDRQYTFDSRTLLHEGHIQSKIQNQWVNKLSPEQLLCIEKFAYKFLDHHKYISGWEGTKYFLSLSQHVDDYFFHSLFPDGGTIVEIGAYDGVHLSNSYSLEKKGWNVVNVEANPQTFELLDRNRPNSRNVNCAVGSIDVDGIDFYIEPIGVLSGHKVDEEDIRKRYEARGIEYPGLTKVRVECMSFKKLITDFRLKSIEVLSIDVEGAEMDVLNGMNFSETEALPKLMVIEANSEEKWKEIKNFVETKSSNQYKLLFDNYQNMFFVHMDFMDKAINAFNTLDLTKVVQANQLHESGDSYAIQSKPWRGTLYDDKFQKGASTLSRNLKKNGISFISLFKSRKG